MHPLLDVAPGHADGREHLERLRVVGADRLGNLQPVDQCALAPAALTLDATEHLQTGRIDGVRAVGVRFEVAGRVRTVVVSAYL